MPSTAFSSTTFFAEARRIARYFVVGGIAACVDIGLFMLFAKGLGLPYLRVSAATFVVATLVNYWLSIRMLFVSGARFRRRWEIALVFAVSAIGLVLNQLILAYHVRAHGEIELGEELAGVKAVPPDKLRPWPLGTGRAVRDWLERRAQEPGTVA